MYFGAHVSIAGGLVNAPLNAAKIGCEVFQMFSRSPHGGWVAPLDDEIAAMFKKNMELAGQRECYIHTPYFVNFASANSRISHGTAAVVREELERGTKLGAKYVMTHMGSYKDLGEEKGFDQLVKGLVKVLTGYTGSTQLLIEISAGAGKVAGHTFEEIAQIIHHPDLKKFPLGVCFDTQHAFGSGYDLRTKEVVDATFKRFDKLIGLDKLKMFHCNDSKIELGGNKDRHEHIGEGLIGEQGFDAMVNYPPLKDKNFILETEHDKVENDLALLFKFRK